MTTCFEKIKTAKSLLGIEFNCKYPSLHINFSASVLYRKKYIVPSHADGRTAYQMTDEKLTKRRADSSQRDRRTLLERWIEKLTLGRLTNI